MARPGRRFRDRVEFLVEHFALFAIAIGESLLLALIVIGGIHILGLVSSGNPIVQLMVDYSGLEGAVIFILGSISLIKDIFTEEESTNDEQGI